ncbi:MAG TPA: DJ-1/PfpI family protein [Lacipirellulaceae bacterium]|jgi:transcriptional regulator GlxA family with amidase domain|nr:DJ-1/PfpI family protein [Lacipirellulaceae bacterium]
MQIDIILFAGFDELDALGPFEVLQNAAELGADFRVRLVSPPGVGGVVGAHGLHVRVEAGLREDPPPDLVVVPGGGWNDRRAQGARAEAERGEIPDYLAELHQAGATIAAVCTGAMLVASAGLLHGRPAITHRGAIDELRTAGANIVPERVVDDGQLITAGGVTSGLDLALWLVERFASKEIAERIAREMEHERVGNVWRRSA